MSAPGKRPRVVFVDLLRLLATFQMVQGHTIDSVLDRSHRVGLTHSVWTFARGLTSVAFLVAAGLAFHLTTLVSFDAHRADRRAAMRRFRRAAFLIFVGYMLHLPVAALGGDPETARAAWLNFSIADVLQCIGITIAALELLVLVLPRASYVVATAAALAVLLIALAPTTQGIAVRGPFTFALQYVTHSGGSFFPLLPWSGYLFAGVVLGALAHGGSRVRSAVTLLAAGVVLIGAGALAGAWLDTTARAVSTPSNLIKLGTVSCVGGALALASLRVERLPRRLETLAGETLVIYGSHLVVLYGSGLGLLYVVGRRLGVGEAIALALVMIVLSAAVGLGWNRVKRAWRNRRRTPLADPAETG